MLRKLVSLSNCLFFSTRTEGNERRRSLAFSGWFTGHFSKFHFPRLCTMPEITQAQIEKWEKDSEILDMVEKILENDLKKTWYLDHLVNN